jgi:imidazolonepropionase-like amidohydrolase
VSVGFTPAEALHSATALPDNVFDGRSHIAVGGRADLLIVNGNPACTSGLRKLEPLIGLFELFPGQETAPE